MDTTDTTALAEEMRERAANARSTVRYSVLNMLEDKLAAGVDDVEEALLGVLCDVRMVHARAALLEQVAQIITDHPGAASISVMSATDAGLAFDESGLASEYLGGIYDADGNRIGTARAEDVPTTDTGGRSAWADYLDNDRADERVMVEDVTAAEDLL